MSGKDAGRRPSESSALFVTYRSCHTTMTCMTAQAVNYPAGGYPWLALSQPLSSVISDRIFN